jgi:hypothetical protein
MPKKSTKTRKMRVSKKMRSKSRSKSRSPKAVRNYSRGTCNSLKKESCSSDPNCQWTQNKKSPCRAKSKVRKGEVYEGPLPKQFK